MKSLSISAVLVFFTCVLQAQVIQNRGFEEWDSLEVENLNGYESSVYEAVFAVDSSNVVKTNDALIGNYAIHLQTVANNEDTLFAYIINGDIDGLSGGQAYNQRPDSLIGFYKYNVEPGDTALIVLSFRHDTTENGTAMALITGSQGAYIRFALPISWSDTLAPDSLIFAAASSNAINEFGITPGSELFLDGLQLINALGDTLNPILNADFENWTMKTSFIPSEWFSSLSDPYSIMIEAVKRTNDAYSGNYAIELTTHIVDGDTMLGYVATYDWMDFSGGDAFSRQIDTLFGYYKYFPQATDSASVFMRFYNASDTTSRGMLLGASQNYSLFELPFNLNFIPDVVQIGFLSSTGRPSNVADGSRLIIDEIDFRICDLPDAPLSLVGDTLACENSQMLQYVAGAATGATSFKWVLPTGFAFSGDSIGDTVLVNVNTKFSGEIKLSGEVYCGLGPEISLFVHVDSIPDQPLIVKVNNDTLGVSVSASSYRWFHNGIALSAQTQRIKASKSGEYSVVALNENCASDTSNIFAFIVAGASTRGEDQIRIYPNPARDVVSIQSADDVIESASLYSLNSSELMLQIRPESNQCQMDLSLMTAGVYVINIQTSNSNFVIKIIRE